MAPNDARIDTFVEYVLETYVLNGCPFPPTMWACYHAQQLIGTTNACGAVHSKMNNMFYHVHSDILSLYDALLEIQEIFYLKMQNSPRISTNPSAAVTESYMAKLPTE